MFSPSRREDGVTDADPTPLGARQPCQYTYTSLNDPSAIGATTIALGINNAGRSLDSIRIVLNEATVAATVAGPPVIPGY